MFESIKNVICEILFDVMPVSTSYEYLVLLVLTTIVVVAMVYLPFAVVRWFFRGFGR